MNKRLLLIGPLPDPKGGVSIHLQRLGNLIMNDFDVKYIDESSVLKQDYFNLRSKNIFTYLRLICWSDIVHVHSGLFLLRIVHLFFAKLFLKKVIITIHFSFKNENLFLQRLNLNLYNKVIFVNKETSEKLSLRSSSIVKEAFIPQDITNEPSLPSVVENWILEKKKGGYQILSANAWRLVSYDNIDLYGLDMCINLINEFKTLNINKVAFVFTVSSVQKDNMHYFDFFNQIKTLGLENEFLLTHENLSFVKIIEHSTIVLRPTVTDGDALTIRESLYMGVPVIASNVVVRPEPTIIFENRNQKDLFNKVSSTLSNIEQIKNRLTSNVSDDYLSFYKNLYKF